MHAGNVGPWLIWAYWINPLTFALKALTVSEFSAPRWQKPMPGNPSVPLGTAILQANDLDSRQWWIGAAIGILIGYIIIGNIVLNIALRVLNGAFISVNQATFHYSMLLHWQGFARWRMCVIYHASILSDPHHFSIAEVESPCSVAAELQGAKAIVEEAGPDDSSVSNHRPAVENLKDSPNGGLSCLAVQQCPFAPLQGKRRCGQQQRS